MPAASSTIHGKERLVFDSPAELRAYYEAKYAADAYSHGYLISGINLSEIYHRARHERALEFLAIQPGEHVLDAGCGIGDMAIALAKKVAHVSAVDIAANAFTKAAEANPGIHFQ